MLSSISYKRCYAEFCVGKISHYTYWRLTATVRRGFNMVLFTERSKHLCRRYMRSIPSALLVFLVGSTSSPKFNIILRTTTPSFHRHVLGRSVTSMCCVRCLVAAGIRRRRSAIFFAINLSTAWRVVGEQDGRWRSTVYNHNHNRSTVGY